MKIIKQDIISLTFMPIMGGKTSTVEKVKEELRVTELGKSLMDEGKKEKTIEIAKKAIKKGLDNEVIKELTDLSIEEIELIREVLK